MNDEDLVKVVEEKSSVVLNTSSILMTLLVATLAFTYDKTNFFNLISPQIIWIVLLGSLAFITSVTSFLLSNADRIKGCNSKKGIILDGTRKTIYQKLLNFQFYFLLGMVILISYLLYKITSIYSITSI